jgi:hypothetical protein
MKMDGNYHIVLKPGASEADFIKHVQTQFSKSPFLTRITTALDHRLFKDETGGFSPRYVLHIRVDLMEEKPYDFHERTGDISALVEAFGVVTAVDVLTLVEPTPASS